jgi:hypothetical protein
MQRFGQRRLRSEKAHGDQHELRRQDFFRAGHVLGNELALVIFGPLDLHGVHGLDVAAGIALKLRRRGQILARIGAELGDGLLLAVIGLERLGPFGPRIVLGAFQRRLRHDFQLRDTLAAVPDRGAGAIRAGVAAADDDDVFPRRGNLRAGLEAVEQVPGVRREKIHREMNALERSAFNRQIARLGRANGQDDGVKILLQFFDRIIFPDLGVADELDAFLFEDGQTPQDDFLLVELHVGNAVHEQAAGAAGAFKNGDRVAGLVQLRGGGKSRRAGADDGHFFAGALLGRPGHDPTLGPGVVNDIDLVVFDGDRRIVDGTHARALARGRTDAAGELRKVVGLVQPVEGFAPQAAVHEIVPFGDQVVNRAAADHAAERQSGMAEGRAAVHAAGALVPLGGLVQVRVEFLPVADALQRRTVLRQFALEL